MEKEIIKEINVQSVMTKSSLPVGGFSVNPYVGCPHACKYCYASFMKRFTGHSEAWGTFLDVKLWKPIDNPHKYDGQRIVIGSVTDGYNPYEEIFGSPPVYRSPRSPTADNKTQGTFSGRVCFGERQRGLHCFR